MQTFDANFFKPFIEGTIITVKTMCNLSVEKGKPFLKGTDSTEIIEIAGVIGLASSAFQGTITLTFPKNVFLVLMNNMLGESFTEITQDLEDGAGELLNVIYGHAKRVLNSQGYSLDKAIPSIVRGSGLVTTHLSKAAIIVMPFKTEKGTFYIEIAIEKH